MSGPFSQQPSPWQQTDLLAMIPAPPAAAQRAAPASGVGSAPGPSPAVADGASGSAPATLLILDTETTGLDPARGRCIEVGAILFAVAERALLGQVSFLLPVEANPAEHINAIPAAVSRLPQPWQAGLQCFRAMLEAAEAVLAHNAAFDRQWFGVDPLPPVRQPWICSMDDIRWPAELHLRATPSVRDLALAHGVPVWAAHRALTDCIYLAQVLERCRDLEGLLRGALEPRHLYRARLAYAERHKAREAGFRWNDAVAGAWSRRLSEAEASALPFPVLRLESDGQDASGAGHQPGSVAA
ncbi:MAG: 3'-5' exonuclease [Cyanobacteria bacterium J06638_7]